MCGIAGIYRFKSPGEDRPVVEAMLERLIPRGPDDQGVVCDGPATLGNRRLAILDLSPAGHQPMQSAGGRYRITFNGEIYNFDDIRKELGVHPSALRSKSDTEVLLLAWERWGAEALPRLVGQWAFAVYDREERRLWLARDRFGEKPLYYHRNNEALTFGSSLAALIQAPWVPRELDRDILAEYLTLRYVVSPRTVLQDVNKLAGGDLLEAGPDGIEVRSWYEPRFRTLAALRKERKQADLVEEFDSLLGDASERCLVSDVPVALLLSDGIDSNSIWAALAGRGHGIPGFTFKVTESGSGMESATSTELPGVEATDLLVTREERLGQMIPAFASLTEPVGDGAALATWLLIRNARERATVFLCGHGGDEVLGGYRLSQDRFRLDVLHRLAWLPQSWTGRTLDRFLYGDESLSTRRDRFMNVPTAELPAAARYLIHRPLPKKDLDWIFAPRQVPDGEYLSVVDRLYGECNDTATDVDRIQEVMLRTFLSENILSFADSVAMDSSAELRMPFLDRDLVEFVLSLPVSARVSQWPGRANTKLIQRWWGREHLPARIVERRKRSFPFGNLPDLVTHHRQTLKDRVLSTVAVRQSLPGLENWLDHPAEYYRGPWEGTLWALLALGIWCDHLDIQ
jgi:asparagine synthase (glutamine-hydrolysing)